MPKRVAGTEGLLGRGDFGANTVTVQDEPRGRLFRPLKTPHEDTEQGCPGSRVREMIAKTRQPASAWCRGAPQMSSGSEVGAGAALGFHNTSNEKKKQKQKNEGRPQGTESGALEESPASPVCPLPETYSRTVCLSPRGREVPHPCTGRSRENRGVSGQSISWRSNQPGPSFLR